MRLSQQIDRSILIDVSLILNETHLAEPWERQSFGIRLIFDLDA